MDVKVYAKNKISTLGKFYEKKKYQQKMKIEKT